MNANPLSELIELDKNLTILEERGKAIRQLFNEMMQRKKENYSVLLSMENNPAVDPDIVKKEVKDLEQFIEFYSLSLSSWDFSIEKIKEFYQQWNLSVVLGFENNHKRRAFLNSFPDMKETLKVILQTLEKMIVIQGVLIIRLEGSVNKDNKSRSNIGQMLIRSN